jgi:hypothetical protein
MTKKLSDLFNLPELPADLESEEETNQALFAIQENRETINQIDAAIDKIDMALPTVRDLEASDQEMDELADLAKDKFNDLMDLGMNMDPRFGGVVFQTAGVLLGHAISAKTAKMDKKLKVIQLQLQKAKLDHQIAKSDPQEKPIDGQGMIIDRNALLDQILQKNKST